MPASIVLPRLRSCWWCHQPSSRIPSGAEQLAPELRQALVLLRPAQLDRRALGTGDAGALQRAERAVVRVAQRLQLDPLLRDAVARDASPLTRSRATSISRSTPTSSAAVSAKPSVPRSCSSVVIATCQPWPSSPSRFVDRHLDVGEEDLVELRLAGDLAQRAHLDAGRVHVDDQVREALRSAARRDR